MIQRPLVFYFMFIIMRKFIFLMLGAICLLMGCPTSDTNESISTYNKKVFSPDSIGKKPEPDKPLQKPVSIPLMDVLKFLH